MKKFAKMILVVAFAALTVTLPAAFDVTGAVQPAGITTDTAPDDIPPVAAVGNAVCRATGLRLVDLPLSPPKISEALDAAAPRLAAE